MSDPKARRNDKVTWWEAALLIRGQTPADSRNMHAMTAWCFVWAVAFCAVSYAIKVYPGVQGPVAWLLALLPVSLGVVVVRALLRYLREADEFTRKIQIEGIAVGFGTGMLFSVGYYFLEQFGAPEISMIYAIVPMSLGWAFGSLFVAARYR